MLKTEPNIRPNWYDGQKVSLNDLRDEQNFQIRNAGHLASATAGSGVVLERPTERIVFDSDDLDEFQQGLVAINSFDGRGIFEEPFLCTDRVGGNQLWIELSGLKLDGSQKTTIVILGKNFENELVYETMEFGTNTGDLCTNHYIEVTNLLFGNFLGNGNDSVDGYASLNLGGRIVVTEAGSMRVGRDCLAAHQTAEPDVVLRDFKTWTSSLTLASVISTAIGSSNDIDDLDINTTTARTREFEAGASTSLIIGQKFKMVGDNIQKVTLLLGLESGSTWSGSLVVSVRALQTSTTSPTDFLPDSEIGFDPSTEALEEVSVTQADLEEQGVVLGATAVPVDFFFSNSDLADPERSGLVDGAYYAITIKRSGSSATGTIFVPEARNEDLDLRTTIFSSSVWTDVQETSLWFKVWTSAVKVASGVVYDAGLRLASDKTRTNSNGDLESNVESGIGFTDTSEGAENYIVVQNQDRFSDAEVHPLTGDSVFSKREDAPLFEAVTQDEAQELIEDAADPVILARAVDRNARSNPVITGQLTKPGLALHNEIHVLNPSSDLLTHSVVGSIITPNTLQPSLRYRIVAQETIVDLYGDVDGDGVVSVDDAVLAATLDGYASDLESGTVADAVQLASVLADRTSIAQIMRADVDGDGVVDSADLAELNAFLSDGTAMTAGSSFTRVLLTVEPLTNPLTVLDDDGESSLEIQDADPSLIDNSSFATVNFSIEFKDSWEADRIEITDLRRFTTSIFLDLETQDLQDTPETAGRNSLFIPGDLYLTGSVKNLDGTHHSLDYEEAVIEIELPTGETSGEINIFDTYVVGQMSFGDGTLVSASAINDDQVRFAVMLSSYAKQVGGADFDEPADGYGTVDVDETIGTSMDHDTGTLRIFAKNSVYNPLLPQNRTRISVIVKMKKAGFANSRVRITPTELAEVLV